MSGNRTVALALSILAMLWPAWPIGAHAQLQTTITVSGTITGPDGPPVPGVRVDAHTEAQQWSTSTNAAGQYSLQVEPEGWLSMSVRPPEALRLAQENIHFETVQGNLTQDFQLVAGHLLVLTVHRPDGTVLDDGMGLRPEPLLTILANGSPFHAYAQFYWLDYQGDKAEYRAVLPPDVYHIRPENAPVPYSSAAVDIDLRSGDRINAVLALPAEWSHPIPSDPPLASLIAIGPPDTLGVAVVRGVAGAVPPFRVVLLANLGSLHQAWTHSEADGSFQASIFAPPGSPIMFKYGPPGWRFRELPYGVRWSVDVFPTTILHAPGGGGAGGPDGIPFATSGAVEWHIAENDPDPDWVGAGWALQGTISHVVVEGTWERTWDGHYEGKQVSGLYYGGMNWTHPALVDIDGDDDLDLFVGERSGGILHYHNQGTATSPEWVFVTDSYAGVDTGDWWAAPAFVDIDADGDLDLFVGTGQGVVEYYRNDGDATTPTWTRVSKDSLSLSNAGNAVPTFVDVDADGDQDLFVGSWLGNWQQGSIHYFRNDGGAATPNWTLVTSSYEGIATQQSAAAAFADIDEDGDHDLFVGYCGSMSFYRNDGTAELPSWTLVSDHYADVYTSCAVSPAFADLDADGDLDLVHGHHWGRLGLYRNEGPPNDVSWVFLGDDFFPIDLQGDSAPALADLDADGDPDMFVGQALGELYQFRNDGTVAEPDWMPLGVALTLPWTDHPHAFPTFVDIDADGDQDLFIGEGGYNGTGMGGNLHFYRNDGSPAAAIWTLVTHSYEGIDVGGWSTPTFVDIDADGDQDLFIGNEEGTLTFYQNDGTPGAPTWAAPHSDYASVDVGDYSAPAFHDVDEDGDSDLFIGKQDGALTYYRNTGTITAPNWEFVVATYAGVDVGEHSTPAFADLDGDGLDDLLVGDGDGGLTLYRKTGSGMANGDPADLSLQRGETFVISGTLRLYSPAIDATTDVGSISVNGGLFLRMLFDGGGNQKPTQDSFMSTRLTPSGFPIQRANRYDWKLDDFTVTGLRLAGEHVVEGSLRLSGQIPDDLPPGTWAPVLNFRNLSGVPADTTQLAANVTGYYTRHPKEALLPPLRVEDPADPQLIWMLLHDEFHQGTRGTRARDDMTHFALAPEIAFQSDRFILPPVDAQTGRTIPYRLEPFLPMISFTDRRVIAPPLIPFDLPDGELRVQVQEPDGTVQELGEAPFAQSMSRTPTTRAGNGLNPGTVQLNDVYQLVTQDDRFEVAFDRYGHHVITMTGTVDDIWGNSYEGGGTYDVWVAHPLDIDPGMLPGTPMAVGDVFNPAMQLYPRVPAKVTLAITVYPDSDPAQAIKHTITGVANRFGYFSPSAPPPSLTRHGEYRVDLTAVYTDTSGEIYMGAMNWGGVVMTPEGEAQLIAHGRRGLDSLQYIPNHWFVSCRDLDIPPGAVSHTLNPYYNGDVLWTRMSDVPCGGDALVLGSSVQDTVGAIEATIRARAQRMQPSTASPGSLTERFSKGEIPLFLSTRSGRSPQVVPDDMDQIAYSYRSAQRPGVRVRELVAEDGESGGYWRLDTTYDSQLSVGILGDLPNDYKFQYIGAVYRDLDTGHNEYLGQGTGWIFIPDDDPLGSRAMPPFAGPGNGGWTTEGGPLLTLKGEDIDIFILPTGVQPGAVLKMGDSFRFAGHVMPTLNSQVAAIITTPSGATHRVDGQANQVGYFYDPDDDFAVDQPGLWSVDVTVWHDGMCSGGHTVPPYPSGDVLGSENGRYWFYVVPDSSPRLDVSSPVPGYLSFESEVTPIIISGRLPEGLSEATVDYTISMPGYILMHGHAAIQDNAYQIVFDPVALQQDFPNLDLNGRDAIGQPGLADTFAIGLLLQAQESGATVYQANTVTLQGDQVFIGDMQPGLQHEIYLPLVLKGG
jgi:hypothetical protein